ncbi:MAG TPA: hypothetical protein VKU37_01620 [Verrucomicrobiae bacterium]|nr:hypothetical protein [Verrucomicrobiae bacterium]
MKRWAVLTVLLYALALILLTAPVLLVAFGTWAKSSIGWQNVLQTYSAWGYWLWLVVLMAGQALLLLLPINLAERRLPARRPLELPVMVTAFFLANLFVAGVFSMLCAIFKDNAFNTFDLPDLFLNMANALNHNPATNASVPAWQSVLSFFLPVLVFWLIWSIIFRRATTLDDPDALLKRITRWLLRGSILELLIAVPSHVVVRRRDDCCAPAGTFWGIATGISVMLLCFGPGVFFLFVERIQRLKPKATNPAAALKN